MERRLLAHFQRHRIQIGEIIPTFSWRQNKPPMNVGGQQMQQQNHQFRPPNQSYPPPSQSTPQFVAPP